MRRIAAVALSIALFVAIGTSAQAQPAPYRMPARLPYQQGHEVPPGYHVEARARKGPVIAGGCVLAGFYAISLLMALAAQDADHADPALGWLYVPLVGPAITASMLERCDPDAWFCSDQARIMVFTILEVGQLVGAAIFAIGLALPEKRVLVRDDLARDGGARWAVVPLGVGRSGAGLAVVGRMP